MKLRLRELLDEKNISVSELSALTGIGRTTLSNLANSEKLPEKTKYETIKKICKSLYILPTDLLKNEPLHILGAEYIRLGDLDEKDGFVDYKTPVYIVRTPVKSEYGIFETYWRLSSDFSYPVLTKEQELELAELEKKNFSEQEPPLSHDSYRIYISKPPLISSFSLQATDLKRDLTSVPFPISKNTITIEVNTMSDFLNFKDFYIDIYKFLRSRAKAHDFSYREQIRVHTYVGFYNYSMITPKGFMRDSSTYVHKMNINLNKNYSWSEFTKFK